MKLKPVLQMTLLALAFAISSCVMVTYEYTMPKQSRVLHQFPKNFLGDYVAEEDSTGTLTITETSFMLPEYSASIGEELEIKPYMSYLVVNMKQEGYWNIYLAQKEDDGSIRVFTIDPEGEETIAQLEEYTAVEVFYDESDQLDRLHIDPTDQEFKAMIGSDLFEDMGLFIPRD